MDCDAEEEDYQGDGKEMEDGAAGGASDEEGNVDDEGGEGAKTEGNGQAEFGFNGDAKACGVGDFAAGSWTGAGRRRFGTRGGGRAGGRAGRRGAGSFFVRS